MRRVCLTLPTHRECAATIAAVGEEAAYGAREFGVEVHLLALDSSPAPVLAAHRAAVAALPPAPGVTVHHLDEDGQRGFLREAIGRSAATDPDRLLELLLPSRVSYGACTDRAFLIAQALGCTSVHRRDSDSRYQSFEGRPVFPLHQELTFLGRPADEVKGRANRHRIAPGTGDRPVAVVGGSFVGEMSVDIAEIHDRDPDVYRELVGLSIPDDCPAIWRGHLVEESFRGAGDTAFDGDRTTLAPVSPTRVDMCNVALDHEVYRRVPLPPATDTIGTDYFLLGLAHDARLPGVQHNRHIVNFHTEERRTDAGFLAYQLRFARFLLAKTYLNAVHARTTAAGDTLLDAENRLRAPAVAEFVRESLARDPEENAHRLGTIERAYRRLGGRYAEVADALAARRDTLPAEVRGGMADFAFLLDHWQALTRACADTGLSVTR
ncbi:MULTISPECIES: DUF6271 family protein [Streptomyces]|uniref:DUF6271 family protein n=1 Tax=Streptomyces TaxID=1883 RepID=UPI00103FAB32|nr:MULTISPECIES: DUF6271 family protein [Streptomyces]MBT3073933.1 hypothetical protein [Streptomyces sp. COG21]MBT3083842.1 hypothetical protein [Streptomyces sp. COG20]MBT3088184.1 hypothetical protein [Streptomyces sp. CYG21]MBT3096730.1 hypothetical protein [Streptomyces sp. CBG30]MBT3101516.1 hypothetical protein [Streptomyces sp. COG19]